MGHRIAYKNDQLKAIMWYSCLNFSIRDKDIHKIFKDETGHDIETVLSARGLDAMIDSTTGRNNFIVDAFIDWFNVNIWGETDVFDD